MSAKAAPQSMESVREVILQALEASPEGELASLRAFCKERGLEYKVADGVCRGLAAASYTVIKDVSKPCLNLTDEARGYLETGSPEFCFLASVPEEGKLLKELQAEGGKMAKLGFAKCMMRRWVKQDKTTGMINRNVEGDVEDVVTNQLKAIAAAPPTDNAAVIGGKDLKDLKKRKLVKEVKITTLVVKKGPRFSTTFKKQVADLTREMLEGDAWKKVDFRPANLKTFGADLNGGFLHPLMKVRSEFRKILLGMGFEEMPTNQFVESSFWNFDSLFQPQSHPARDAHDTFFIKDPAQTISVPEDYLAIVKKTHEEGGFGSVGYHCTWKREEAFKNLLRTHTTAISAKMLYKLGQEYVKTGTFQPKKYFSIDRVFRNETMDATHLAEFHQVEFFVADYNLTLGHLISLLETFFHKIGIKNLRFKPAYNPYTEPSMEIFGFHPDLNRWTEIGNSGMFRPEMLRPMGLPEGVRVIAGGLSLERPTMIKYRIDNIRELFGHKIDLKKTKTSQLPRFF